MTQQEKDKIISLFEQYEGTIFDNDDRIAIEADNLISNGIRYKVNKCTVRIVWHDRSYSFNWGVEAEERGLEILGGCAMPCDDLNDAIGKARRQLKHYNFKKKEQLSLF